MATKFVLKKNLSNAHATENPATEEFFFDGTIFTIGSDAANNLILPEAAPEQMVVMHEDGQLTLINSADGTSLNRQNLRREAMQPLAVGDEIGVGGYVIFVADGTTERTNGHSEKVSSALAENSNDFIFENNAAPFSADAEKSVVNSPKEAKAPRNFAEVLDTLRTEEDSFYFTVERGGDTTRIPLENAETPIGETAAGKIAFVIEQIAALYAVARKDWSGILLESKRRGAVFVNGEPLETTRRLRNDDLVTFAAPAKFSLLLHEPSSLVALESLLSARADHAPVTRLGVSAANNPNAALNQTATPAAATQPKVSLLERQFFNHFSFVEIVSMTIGTLIGAVLFFLLFEIVLS